MLERFQRELGFEQSSQLANLPADYKGSNIERDLANEMAEAVQSGLWKDTPPEGRSVALSLKTWNKQKHQLNHRLAWLLKIILITAFIM